MNFYESTPKNLDPAILSVLRISDCKRDWPLDLPICGNRQLFDSLCVFVPCEFASHSHHPGRHQHQKRTPLAFLSLFRALYSGVRLTGADRTPRVVELRLPLPFRKQTSTDTTKNQKYTMLTARLYCAITLLLAYICLGTLIF